MNAKFYWFEIAKFKTVYKISWSWERRDGKPSLINCLCFHAVLSMFDSSVWMTLVVQLWLQAKDHLSTCHTPAMSHRAKLPTGHWHIMPRTAPDKSCYIPQGCLWWQHTPLPVHSRGLPQCGQSLGEHWMEEQRWYRSSSQASKHSAPHLFWWSPYSFGTVSGSGPLLSAEGQVTTLGSTREGPVLVW